MLVTSSAGGLGFAVGVFVGAALSTARDDDARGVSLTALCVALGVADTLAGVCVRFAAAGRSEGA